MATGIVAFALRVAMSAIITVAAQVGAVVSSARLADLGGVTTPLKTIDEPSLPTGDTA